MTTSPVITSEIQKLAPSAIVELFILDTTHINGDISYFHSGTNGLNQNIIWQGQEYFRYPVEASGFEYTGNGQIPRPKMVVSNAFGTITALILELGNDLIGSKVTRIRTLAKCLDAANFPGNINPDADPAVEWPREIYYVDRKASEGPDVVEFELATASDLQGIRIPKRQIIANLCPFIYRGSDCGYSGPPTFDANDMAMTSASSAEGQLMLDRYAISIVKKQLWVNAVAATQAAKSIQEVACDITRLETKGLAINGNIPPAYGVVTDPRGNVLGAYWGGVKVTLGVYYRTGSLYTSAYSSSNGYYSNSRTFVGYIYYIEKWGVDTVLCSAKTALYNAAVIAQEAARIDYVNAVNDYQAAFEDVPLDDPLYSRDVCGKKITSCKARFGEDQPLSFGGFPSASLIK